MGWQLWVREKPQIGLANAVSGTTATTVYYPPSEYSVQTKWGGQAARFRLVWEKKSFPTDLDLSVMSDLPLSNMDWLHAAATRI